jgi:hypothetical protein
MNQRTICTAVASGLLGMCLALVGVNTTSAQIGREEKVVGRDLIDDTQPPQTEMNHSRRFQALSHNGDVYLFDTATGRGWRLSSGQGWVRFCGPPSATNLDSSQ